MDYVLEAETGYISIPIVTEEELRKMAEQALKETLEEDENCDCIMCNPINEAY